MKLVEEARRPLPSFHNSVLSVYHDAESGFRVVVCPAPGPICDLTFLVATAADNNKGLPHCLEHLIFMGSAKHRRGYLDTLANRSFCNGTNAWTDSDHTAYTASIAGSEGALKLIPVFLDHILHPTLTDSAFKTEVFHIDGEGNYAGVVYAEMQAREVTEGDLLDNGMRRLVYPNSPYAYECGGLTPDIAKLTNEEVRNYHAKFYTPSSITLLIVGCVNEQQVITTLNATLDMSQYSTQRLLNPWKADLPPMEASSTEIVQFPSHDESVGSVGIGFRGPEPEDVDSVVSWEILLRYLSEGAASPLQQTFVELETPIASTVYASIELRKSTLIEFTFYSVPHGKDHHDGDNLNEEAISGKRKFDERSDAGNDNDNDDDHQANIDGDEDMGDGEEGEEDDDDGDDDGEEEEEGEEGSNDDDDEEGEGEGEGEKKESHSNANENMLQPGKVLQKLQYLLRDIVAKGFPENAIKNAVARHKLKLLEQIEDEPVQQVISSLVHQVLFYKNPHDIGKYMEINERFERLSAKPDSYWISLIEKWLLGTPCAEVITVPSIALANQRAKEGESCKAERLVRLGNDGLVKLKKEIEQAIVDNEKKKCDDREYGDDISYDSIPKLPYALHQQQPEGDVPFQINVIRCDSLFHIIFFEVECSHLPDSLRDYLELFWALMPSLPVKFPDQQDIVSFQDVINAINRETVSLNWSSFDNELLPQYASLEGVSLPTADGFASLCKWMKAVMFFSLFTPERIRPAISNLKNDIADNLRDGRYVCDDIMLYRASTDPNALASSLHRQKLIVNKFYHQAKTEEGALDICQKLEHLRRCIVSDPSRISVFLSIPNDAADPVPALVATWKEGVSFFSEQQQQQQQQQSSNIKLFDAIRLQNSTKFVQGTTVVGLESTYVQIMVPCRVLTKDKDAWAIKVLCQMLCRSEGPLATAIRGQGFAYDADLSYLNSIGAIFFALSEAAEAGKALVEFYKILREVPAMLASSHIQGDLKEAKSSLLSYVHTQRSTPNSILSQTVRAMAMEIPNDKINYEFAEASIIATTSTDLQHVYDKYFSQFLVSGCSTTAIATSPTTYNKLKTELSALQEPIQVLTIAQFAPSK